MKRKAKKLMLAICCAALVGSAGVASVNAISANASTDTQTTNTTAPTITATDFALEQSASIKRQAPYGIRFTANLSVSAYGALTANGATVTYGMLITPADYATTLDVLPDLDDTTGTFKEYNKDDATQAAANYTNTYRNIVNSAGAQEVKDSDGVSTTGYTFVCGIENIDEDNISRPFMAVGYITYTLGNVTKTYYTAPFSRSIYSVATYAVADETQTYTDAQLSYLYNVINEVNGAYTDVTYSVTDVEGKTKESVQSGDYVKIVANVKKPGGTNVLDACPVFDETDRLVAQDEPFVYRVKGLDGAFDLDCKIGDYTKIDGTANDNDVTGTYNVPALTTAYVFNSEETASNIVDFANPNYNKINSMQTTKYIANYMGKSNVLKMTYAPEYANGEDQAATNNSYYFVFDSWYNQETAAGKYLYMDCYFPKNWESGVFNLTYGGLSARLMGSAGYYIDDVYQWYTADGTAICDTGNNANLNSSSTYRYQWLRVELKLDSVLGSSAWRYLGANARPGESSMYISDIMLSNTKLDSVGQISVDKEISLSVGAGKQFFAFNTANTSLTAMSEGITDENNVTKTNVYSWATTVGANSNNLTFNSEIRGMFGKANAYFYVDILLYQDTTLYVNIGGTDITSGFYNAKEYPYIYSKTVNEVSTPIATWSVYDASGNVKNAAFWSSNFEGEWITLEIQWHVNMSTSVAETGTPTSSQYPHDSIGIYGNGKPTAELPFYIANPRFSLTKLDLTAN